MAQSLKLKNTARRPLHELNRKILLGGPLWNLDFFEAGPRYGVSIRSGVSIRTAEGQT